MTPFRFRLAKVLDWHQKQAHLEAERLRLAVERAAQAKVDLESHQRDVLKRRRDLIESPNPEVLELIALGPFLRGAKQREQLLLQKCATTEQEASRQRGVSLAADRRLRLFEKLRERQLADHDYEASRELENLASETYLAGFARNLNENSPA